MLYTANIMTSAGSHKLEHLDDASAKAIIKWWLPDGTPEVVAEYYYNSVKDGTALVRAILLRRSSIVGIDITQEPVKAGVAVQPVAPGIVLAPPS